MTPAERVVVAAAVRWHSSVQAERPEGFHAELDAAVDALLAERAGPQAETVEITWTEVVEGDQIYRHRTGGGPVPLDSPAGAWFTVTDRGGLMPGTNRIRLHAKGIGRPIQPVATRLVTVKRGATGKAVDMLGSVLWSGANMPAAILHSEIVPPPAVIDVAHDPEASEEES